jgi:hypothetical protein
MNAPPCPSPSFHQLISVSSRYGWLACSGRRTLGGWECVLAFLESAPPKNLGPLRLPFSDAVSPRRSAAGGLYEDKSEGRLSRSKPLPRFWLDGEVPKSEPLYFPDWPLFLPLPLLLFLLRAPQQPSIPQAPTRPESTTCRERSNGTCPKIRTRASTSLTMRRRTRAR